MPQSNQEVSRVDGKRRRDLPALIKWILLGLLILLLLVEIFTGEFSQIRELGSLPFLILFLKLLLIAILIWLIRVQRRLVCRLDKPTGCTEEEPVEAAGGLAVEVVGSAYGAMFGHYVLEWRLPDGKDCGDDADWSSDGVVYPGGGPTGGTPVINGTLGWINTTVWTPGPYEVRLCVYPYQAGGSRCCHCTGFTLFKKLVWIDRVAINPGAPVETPPGPFVSGASIVNTNPGGTLVPVGGCVTIEGSAFVGECNNRKIKCFDLKFAEDFLPGPLDAGFNPAVYTTSALQQPVCYIPPEESQKRAIWNWVIRDALTVKLIKTTVDLFGNPVDLWKLQEYCFNSASKLPACLDAEHHCHSGRYTLLLDVEDTLGNHYYDTQHVWFDNKPIHVRFSGLAGVMPCKEIHLGPGGAIPLPHGAPCDQPWPLDVEGIVYDEYIDENDMTYPSNNFDFYWMRITRQGGPTYNVPITPDLVTLGANPLRGTERVGEPGSRCEDAIGGCTPVVPTPLEASGVLTQIDLRIFDEVCAASLSPPFAPPAGFPLKRDTCCGFTFQIHARDKTWSDGWAGGYHRRWSLPWAVCICNDLPKP